MKGLFTYAFLISTLKFKGLIIAGSICLLLSWMFNTFYFETYDNRIKKLNNHQLDLEANLGRQVDIDLGLYLIRSTPENPHHLRYLQQYLKNMILNVVGTEFATKSMMSENEQIGILRNTPSDSSTHYYYNYLKRLDEFNALKDSIGHEKYLIKVLANETSNIQLAQIRNNEMIEVYSGKSKQFSDLSFGLFVAGSLLISISKVQQYYNEHLEKEKIKNKKFI